MPLAFASWQWPSHCFRASREPGLRHISTIDTDSILSLEGVATELSRLSCICVIAYRYGRHALKRSAGEWLYKYIRENFYYAVMLGENDLISEFTEALRAYGCTETSDRQLRDGTRTLLKLYTDGGKQWRKVKDPSGMGYDKKGSGKAYDDLHKPWTVRPRHCLPNALRTLHSVLTPHTNTAAMCCLGLTALCTINMILVLL